MFVKPNSNRYEGSWFGDLKHGKGKYWHLETGQLQKGVWVKNICVFCTFNDIKYRQSALIPTSFPLHKVSKQLTFGVKNVDLKKIFFKVFDQISDAKVFEN